MPKSEVKLGLVSTNDKRMEEQPSLGNTRRNVVHRRMESSNAHDTMLLSRAVSKEKDG